MNTRSAAPADRPPGHRGRDDARYAAVAAPVLLDHLGAHHQHRDQFAAQDLVVGRHGAADGQVGDCRPHPVRLRLSHDLGHGVPALALAHELRQRVLRRSVAEIAAKHHPHGKQVRQFQRALAAEQGPPGLGFPVFLGKARRAGSAFLYCAGLHEAMVLFPLLLALFLAAPGAFPPWAASVPAGPEVSPQAGPLCRFHRSRRPRSSAAMLASFAVGRSLHFLNHAVGGPADFLVPDGDGDGGAARARRCRSRGGRGRPRPGPAPSSTGRARSCKGLPRCGGSSARRRSAEAPSRGSARPRRG